MATRNEDLRYRLLGEDVSAGRTFSKVANEARGAHTAISELGQTLNSTGAFTPLTQGLDAISAGFDHIKENGKSARVVMQGVGIGMAAAGAALLGLGANAQQASAGLKQAIQDAGGTWSEYSKQVEETVAKTATFGRTAGDTENALARLVTATQDPQRALSLMGLTANIAAARQMNLTDSAQMLTTALAGNTRVFRQFGINVGHGKLSADQLNKALDELIQRLAGRAQAQADTFSGRIKGMAVEFENAAEGLTKFAPLLIAAGTTMTAASAGWDLLARAKERNAVADAANVASSRRVVAAEGEAAAAAATAAGGYAAIGEAGAAGIVGPAFTRGNFLRAGGIAVGGLVAGQVASTALGNGQTGSVVSDALRYGAGGAALGSFVGPEGTVIGGALGAVGGSVYGYFNHGSGSRGKLEALKAQQAQQQAVDQAAMDSFAWSEFDPTGNPKAAKLAAATDALSKAKVRLARAQEDLNKQQSRGEDPAKVAAAVAHLDAAQANLRKALYIGGDARTASARAAVASAEARLNALHAGTDTTAAGRRVSDARAAVAAAARNVAAARGAASGLNAGQFYATLSAQVGNKQQAAQDVARLANDYHIDQPVLKQIEAQGDATLHNIAQSMNTGLAVKYNRADQALNAAAKAWQTATTNAYKAPAEAIGKQLAEWSMGAYQRHLIGYKPGFVGPVASPATGAIQSLLSMPSGGTYIQNLQVLANNPQQFTRQLDAQARHRALSHASL